MAEDHTESLSGDSTDEIPFEEFVRRQFELILARQENVKSQMVERFAQVNQQMRHLDQKLDVFILEQLDLKDELRELSAAQSLKNGTNQLPQPPLRLDQ